MLVEYVTGGSVARKAVVHDRFVESSSSTKRGSFVPAVRNSCPAWRLTRSLEFIAGWNHFLKDKAQNLVPAFLCYVMNLMSQPYGLHVYTSTATTTKTTQQPPASVRVHVRLAHPPSERRSHRPRTP